jgi:hypothetical protein
MDEELTKPEIQTRESPILFQYFNHVEDETLNKLIDQNNAESTYFQCLYAWIQTIPEQVDSNNEKEKQDIMDITGQFIAYANFVSKISGNKLPDAVQTLETIHSLSNISTQLHDIHSAKAFLPTIEKHFRTTYLDKVDRQTIPLSDIQSITPDEDQIDTRLRLLRHGKHEIDNPFSSAYGFFDLYKTFHDDQYYKNGLSQLHNTKKIFEHYGQNYTLEANTAVGELKKQCKDTVVTSSQANNNQLEITFTNHTDTNQMEQYTLQGSEVLFIQLINNVMQNTHRMYDALDSLPSDTSPPREALKELSEEQQTEHHRQIPKRLTVTVDTVDEGDVTFLHTSFRDFGTGFPDALRQPDGTFRFKENVTGYVGGKKGNGIGMAALQSQIESLGGKMRLTNVEDEQGTGALLEVFFKLSPSETQS